MPQEFQVVRCYSCQTFQGQQVKKAKKWSCKVCGEKQSYAKIYGQGSGKDCRLHVQKLNAMAADLQHDVEDQVGNEEDDRGNGGDDGGRGFFTSTARGRTDGRCHRNYHEDARVNDFDDDFDDDGPSRSERDDVNDFRRTSGSNVVVAESSARRYDFFRGGNRPIRDTFGGADSGVERYGDLNREEFVPSSRKSDEATLAASPGSGASVSAVVSQWTSNFDPRRQPKPTPKTNGWSSYLDDDDDEKEKENNTFRTRKLIRKGRPTKEEDKGNEEKGEKEVAVGPPVFSFDDRPGPYREREWTGEREDDSLKNFSKRPRFADEVKAAPGPDVAAARHSEPWEKTHRENDAKTDRWSEYLDDGEREERSSFQRRDGEMVKVDDEGEAKEEVKKKKKKEVALDTPELSYDDLSMRVRQWEPAGDREDGWTGNASERTRDGNEAKTAPRSERVIAKHSGLAAKAHREVDSRAKPDLFPKMTDDEWSKMFEDF